MKKVWWKEAVVYQVYWRSFLDTNGDGYGDLQGVIKKLDYIKELGIDIIWLNPCFESPDVDNGYDISDYYGVMKKAGTMKDFQKLIEEIHARGMKIIMDLVVNHTSDQHPWFLESRSSRHNDKRDYYIWRDQPNNWRSYFSPSAWEYDALTEQSYFHAFAPEQPDLNWANPAVREEIYRLMAFWLEKGMDGFRLDAIAMLDKEEGFPDADDPDRLDYLGNKPKVHDYLHEMHEAVLKKYNAFTVGEVAFAGPEEGLKYVQEDREELNTIFHFQVLDEMWTWDLKRFREIQNNWHSVLWNKGWNSQFINNHDHTRVVTRFGNDEEYRVQSAKLFAVMVHLLPGTPYIYQGEEIGMTGVRFPSINDYNDIAMKNKFKEDVANGKDPAEVLDSLIKSSRDNSRTPMQWTDEEHAGFTHGKPWITVNPNYKELNVENDLARDDSIYRFYQKLIGLRKKHDVIVYGDYEDVSPEGKRVYRFKRMLGSSQLNVFLNISNETVTCSCDSKGDLLIGNYPEEEMRLDLLQPWEARVYAEELD